MIKQTSIVALMAGFGLMGCESPEGTTSYRGPDSYIAVAVDRGRDSGTNVNDNAAIATTPDGCQAWLIDDGLEGRASNRFDPVSGLPVCGGQPGVVYGPYQSGSQGIADRVPRAPANMSEEYVEVRSYEGQYQTVHPTEQPHTHGEHPGTHVHPYSNPNHSH